MNHADLLLLVDMLCYPSLYASWERYDMADKIHKYQKGDKSRADDLGAGDLGTVM